MSEITGLRPYQIEALDAIACELSSVRSVLVVMATGTGKTQVFVAFASRWLDEHGGRCLILAHRDELVEQAAARVAQMLGEVVGVEKAERRAGAERIVVASVQSLRGERLRRWSRDEYSLVIVDEAHHAPAETYTTILDHLSGAHVLGVTATPDRADAQAMGRVFDAVAYEYDVLDAIRDGWLVPPLAVRVHLSRVDLRGVKTERGELSTSGLVDALSLHPETLETITRSLVEQGGERSTLIYTPTVAYAHLLATAGPDVRAVDGTTLLEDRRGLLRAHERGEFRSLANCAVLTEGYDSPLVSRIVILRHTKSRALYAQMLGRGLRPAPGKADCLLLDYHGVADRLDVVGPEDVLGGSMDAAVVEEARKKPDPNGSVLDALAAAQEAVDYRAEQARLLTERRQRGATKRKTIALSEAWPLLGLDRRLLSAGERYGLAEATERQLDAIRRLGVEPPAGLSRGAASAVVGVLIQRSRSQLASPAQLRVLARYHLGATTTTRGEASTMIDAIAQAGWRRPVGLVA